MSGNFLTAVHLIAYLTYRAGRETLVTSDELADTVRQNPVVVRRLISKLREAGLVDTVRGKTGGFRLNRPATEIDLLSVFTAIEGKDPDLFSLAHMSKRPDCHPIANSIQQTLTDVLQQSISAMKSEMANHSIDSVLDDSLTRIGIIRCR